MTEERELEPIDEELAIGELLKMKDFQMYYKLESIEKIKPIYWVVDPGLGDGNWGSAGWAKQKKGKLKETYIPIVNLQKVPVKAEHATRVAHEIQHLLLDKEGFPRVICTQPPNPVLTMALKSMVQDPLINLRLKPYGFDVKRDHMEVLEDYRRRLIQCWPKSPIDSFTKLLLTINYVRNILRWETAFGNDHQEDNDFQRWFDERYPDIVQEGKALLKLVRKTGYKDPREQRLLFNKINENRDKYGIRLNFLPKPLDKTS